MTTEATDVTPPLSSTARTRLGRKKDRAATDRGALYDVLDNALVCHLGIVRNGTPVVLPTGFGRAGDTLYVHGSAGARSMLAARDGIEVCVTVTIVDGVVYSRSINDHSMNYRSAMIFGTARPVTGPTAKTEALRVLTDHLAPGSWAHARELSSKEIASVTVLAVPLTEASVKVRTGGPADDPADVAANAAWAGVLPISTAFGEPVPAADLDPTWTVPAHVAAR